MSSVSLGAEAKCGKLKCDVLEAKNSGGDPHKIVGDFEVTGDCVVDGKLTAKQGDVRVEHKDGLTQSGVTLRCPDQTWDITADSTGDVLTVGLFKDSAPAGVEVFSIQDNGGNLSTGLVANPLALSNPAGATADPGLTATHHLIIKVNSTEYKLLLATP